MRKLLRLSVFCGLLLALLLPVSGLIHAQDSNSCDVQNGVLIGTLSSGINCLDAKGLSEYQIESSGLPVSSLDDVAICPDHKTIYALNTFGIVKFDGSAWSDLEVPSEVVAPSGIACAPNGDIWVAHTSGLSHYDGTNWKSFDSKEFGSGDFIVGVNDVAVSDKGDVWAVTNSSVAHYNDGSWDIFENGKGFDTDYAFGGLAINSDGQPVVVATDNILTYDGSKWSAADAPITGLEKVMVDGKGRLWVGSLTNGVAVNDGGNWTVYDMSKGLSDNTVNALDFDSKGRVWVGTDWGLNVLDGDKISVLQMSNSDLLDNDVQHITVIGDGPDLPATSDKDPGTITGVLVNGRDPAPNLQVELCSEYVGGVFYGDTPCAGQPNEMLVTSDDKGEFTFDKVPVGRYEITINTADGWIYFIGSDKIEVQSGQKNDLAYIDISKTS